MIGEMAGISKAVKGQKRGLGKLGVGSCVSFDY